MAVHKQNFVPKMLEGLCNERGRKSRVICIAPGGHNQQPFILFIGRKEGRVVRMDDTQIMAAGTTLYCLVTNVKTILLLEKSFLIPVSRQHMGNLSFWMNWDDCIL